jgi:isopropylmalate/homocitrate/citramalate synthase
VNGVVWTDVAPRDRLQNIADAVSTAAKIRLVRGLLDAGVAGLGHPADAMGP